MQIVFQSNIQLIFLTRVKPMTSSSYRSRHLDVQLRVCERESESEKKERESCCDLSEVQHASFLVLLHGHDLLLHNLGAHGWAFLHCLRCYFGVVHCERMPVTASLFLKTRLPTPLVSPHRSLSLSRLSHGGVLPDTWSTQKCNASRHQKSVSVLYNDSCLERKCFHDLTTTEEVAADSVSNPDMKLPVQCQM